MDDELKRDNIPEEEKEEFTDKSDENELIHERYCDYIIDKYGTWIPFY